MLDIEELKPLIVERLKSLQPSKIILFGSYAYGTPTDDSDIDLFLLKDDLDIKEMRNYKLELQKRLFKEASSLLPISTPLIFNKALFEEFMHIITALIQGYDILHVKDESEIPELNIYQCGTCEMHSLQEAHEIAQKVLENGVGIMDNEALKLDLSKL